MSDSKTLSRRNFLKGSAVLAAGAAAVGLTGCAPQGASDSSGGTSAARAGNAADVSWDKTADIVIIGSGTAALAALAASDYGAESIIILEKGDTFGGTSALSGGGVGIPLTHIATEAGVTDSIEAVMAYYKSGSGGRADLAVAESYVNNGDKCLTWAEDKLGFTWGFTQKMYQDYYEPCEGYLGFGRGNISVKTINGVANESNAAAVWAYFLEKINEDDKIELILKTAATDFVTDDTGAVVGVMAEGMNVGANKAVIVATGGFEHDDDMRAKHLPYPLLSATSVATNTGDGHKMGMRIGAQMANMDSSWGLPSFFVSGENAQDLLNNGQIAMNFKGFDANTYRAYPGSCVVNKKGERIGNECAAYDVFNRAFGRFDSGTSSMVSIPAFFICDSTVAGVYRLPGQAAATDPIPEFFTQANSLEELATALGIDAAGLTKEMNDFNANAANGVDPKFGRGSHEFDINTDGVYAGMRTDIPNPVLSPVATPPFYGTIMVPGTFGTCGGFKINEYAQVLNVDGDVIPNLYAIGNCSCGVSGGAYLHGGQTVGSGFVMGWIAARTILGVTD